MQELRADRAEQERFRAAVRDGDPDTAAAWAGEGLDLISSLEPAADIAAASVRTPSRSCRMLRGGSLHRRCDQLGEKR